MFVTRTTSPVRECVGAILIRGESILLGKRSAQRDFYPGVWDVFGGHIEVGESFEQTLRRELQEELGILPTAWKYFETLRELDPASGAGLICHFFVVTEWQGMPENMQPQEHSEIEWYRIADVAQLHLAHPEYVRLFRSARKFLEDDEKTYSEKRSYEDLGPHSRQRTRN